VARFRARSLYRDWYRSAPEICELYAINITPASIRSKVRQVAESHRHIEDLQAYDVLLHKWYVDYQEIMNIWKQEIHVYEMFAKDMAPAKPLTFMDKFLTNRDGDRVQSSA